MSALPARTTTSDGYGKRHRDVPGGYDPSADLPLVSHKAYKSEMGLLQIELVSLQRHVISHGDKILIVLEGLEAAGKVGNIKRIVERFSPRDTPD